MPEPTTLEKIKELGLRILEDAKNDIQRRGRTMPHIVLTNMAESRSAMIAVDPAMMDPASHGKDLLADFVRSLIVKDKYDVATMVMDTWNVKFTNKEEADAFMELRDRLPGRSFEEYHKMSGLGQLLESVMLIIETAHGFNLLYRIDYTKKDGVIAFGEIQDMSDGQMDKSSRFKFFRTDSESRMKQ